MMVEDIVCMLQDLGREISVDVIVNFIMRNPDVEDLIAAKMGILLSSPGSALASSSISPDETSNHYISPSTTTLNSREMSLSFAGFGTSSLKMIFVVNMDLNMSRGKQCAQVAHATLGLYLKIQQSGNDENHLRIYQWLSVGQKKIIVRGNDLDHMKKIQEDAEEAKLPNFLVSDAGCTQIAPGSKTVLAIFGTNEELDKITGALRLL